MIAEVKAVLGDGESLPRWWPAVYLDVVPGDERRRRPLGSDDLYDGLAAVHAAVDA